MNRLQLEGIVLDAVDRALRGEIVEDDRIELKAEWPDPDTSVRQLAGAANRAKGQPLIYVIGVDEKRQRLVPIANPDVAIWWAKVQSAFNEVAPELLNQLNVNVNGTDQVAVLEFGTSAVPYVIRRPGKDPDREIPIRDGTRTRSANRNELVRLLVAETILPGLVFIDVGMSGDWTAHRSGDATHSESPERTALAGRATLFVEQLPTAAPVMLPAHEMKFVLRSNGDELTGDCSSWMNPRNQPPAIGVAVRRDGVLITGPGLIPIRFGLTISGDARQRLRADYWDLSLELGVVGSTNSLRAQKRLLWRAGGGPGSIVSPAGLSERFGVWEPEP